MLAFFVEIDGFEPTTLCLQSRCSSQLSYTPVFSFLLSVFGVGLRIVCQSFTEVNSFHPRLPAWNPSQNKLQKFKKLLSVFGVGLRIVSRSLKNGLQR